MCRAFLFLFTSGLGEEQLVTRDGRKEVPNPDGGPGHGHGPQCGCTGLPEGGSCSSLLFKLRVVERSCLTLFSVATD